MIAGPDSVLFELKQGNVIKFPNFDSCFSGSHPGVIAAGNNLISFNAPERGLYYIKCNLEFISNGAFTGLPVRLVYQPDPMTAVLESVGTMSASDTHSGTWECIIPMFTGRFFAMQLLVGVGVGQTAFTTILMKKISNW